MLYSFLTGDACTIVLAAAEGADRLKNIGNVPCGAHLHYTAQLVLTSVGSGQPPVPIFGSPVDSRRSRQGPFKLMI